MRKIISLICFLMILSCALTLTTFAQTDDFYYNWGANPLFDELWNENNKLELKRHNNRAKDQLIAQRYVTEEQFDPTKLTFDLEHTVCQLLALDTQQVIDYIKSDCDPQFVKNNLEYYQKAYFVPFYYEGIETTHYLSCWYNKMNDVYFSSYESLRIQEPDINLMIYSPEKLENYFEKNKFVGYQPKQYILLHDATFIICKAGDEYRLVYIPTMTPSEIIGDKNAYYEKKFDFTDDPVFTTERLIDVFGDYEKQLSKIDTRPEKESANNSASPVSPPTEQNAATAPDEITDNIDFALPDAQSATDSTISTGGQNALSIEEEPLSATDEINYTGVVRVDEVQPQYPWLYWIIGGAVIVIGGLVTVILVKKKKA